MNLPQDVDVLIEIINKNGFEAFLVGGCVRDSLLGNFPNDFDIATNAKPNDIINIFKNYKLISNGVEFGTIGVVINEIIYEITTYRVESTYKNNRKPTEVIFSNDIHKDLKRRDFTINAMAYNKKCGILDLFNGKDDLKRKLIRTVKNPDDRFKEDALRMIRAIRFSAKLNFLIEENTLKSIYRNSNLIKNISIERITDEFIKIIQSENPRKIILFFKTCLFYFMGINYDINFKFYKNIEDNLQIIKEFKTLEEKIVVFEYILFNHYNLEFFNKIKYEDYDLRKDLLKSKLSLTNTLKFSNKTKKNIYEIFEIIILYNKDLDRLSIKNILKYKDYDLTLKSFNILKKYYYTNNFLQKSNKYIEYIEVLEEIKENKECYKICDLKINGTDLINLGYNGKDIGKNLEYLLKMVIQNNSLNNKNTLIELLADKE